MAMPEISKEIVDTGFSVDYIIRVKKVIGGKNFQVVCYFPKETWDNMTVKELYESTEAAINKEFDDLVAERSWQIN